MGFILTRFSFYLVAFLVAATINFLLPRAMPGDPVSVMFARAGAMMEPAALEALKARAPKRIVYISCYPQSLVRDFKVLAAAGWRGVGWKNLSGGIVALPRAHA